MSAMLTMIWPMARRGSTDLGSSERFGDGCYHKMRERPVIPAQRGRPASSSRVGATSARTPSRERRPRAARPTRTNGTGLSECAVTGLPVGVAQLVGVAVVGGDGQDRPGGAGIVGVDRQDRGDDPGEAAVDDLERRDRRVPDAGVADHVRVGEVGDDEVVAARARSPRPARR